MAETAEENDGRPLGIWMCTALVVGNMIGSGEFLLPAALAPYGWSAVAGWLVTIGGTMAIAFVFARLAPARPLAGGPYAYARLAFGPMLGFAVAWTYWLGVVIGNAAIATGSVSYLSLIFPVLRQVHAYPPLLSVGIIWVLTLVNCLGVRSAGRFQLVATLIKVVPLGGVVALAVYLIASGAARPSVPFRAADLRLGGTMASAALALWGLVGLESATVPADRVHDPRRTIPRATLVGTAFTGALYLFACSAVQLLQPAGAVGSSSAPFADFLSRYLGGSAGILIAAFAAFSGFGALNGWVLMQGELPRAMAADGIFPVWFGRTTANGTPVRAHLTASAILTVSVLMNFDKSMLDLFTFVALLGTTTALCAYFFTALAALRLQRMGIVEGGPALSVAAALAAAYAAFAIVGAGKAPMFWGGAFFVAALLVYTLPRALGRGRTAAAPLNRAA